MFQKLEKNIYKCLIKGCIPLSIPLSLYIQYSLDNNLSETLFKVKMNLDDA